MKIIYLTLIGVFLTVNVYAVELCVVITKIQYDAMSIMTVTPEEWVQSAVSSKSNSMVEKLVRKYSDKQPGKITQGQKDAIIRKIDLEKERNERRGK